MVAAAAVAVSDQAATLAPRRRAATLSGAAASGTRAPAASSAAASCLLLAHTGCERVGASGGGPCRGVSSRAAVPSRPRSAQPAPRPHRTALLPPAAPPVDYPDQDYPDYVRAVPPAWNTLPSSARRAPRLVVRKWWCGCSQSKPSATARQWLPIVILIESQVCECHRLRNNCVSSSSCAACRLTLDLLPPSLLR